MSTEQALVAFILGFVRAAGLTFFISLASYWDHDLAVILIGGIIGGVITMKQMEERL